MSETSPTRAVVLELKDEQRAMHEGYVFLDEKCLLLAGEMERAMMKVHAKPPRPKVPRPAVAADAVPDEGTTR